MIQGRLEGLIVQVFDLRTDRRIALADDWRNQALALIDHSPKWARAASMSAMAMLRQLLSLLTPRHVIRGCLGYLEALVRGLIANTMKALRHAFELRVI